MITLRNVLLLLIVSSFAVAEEQAAVADAEAEVAAAPMKKEKPVFEQTPEEMEMYNAAREGRIDKLRSLIAEGINIDMQNKQGRTPLMAAVYKRNHGVIRELMAEGADIDLIDGKGKTVLMLAVLAQDDRMIKSLLALGADNTIKDDAGRTAEDYAMLTNNKRIITVFRPEPDCEEGDEECLAAAEAEQMAKADTPATDTSANDQTATN